MPHAFLPAPPPTAAPLAPRTAHPAEPRREKVKLLVMGSPHATERVVHELYRVGFAEVREWSKPLPTGNAGEVLRILTRYVLAGG